MIKQINAIVQKTNEQIDANGDVLSKEVLEKLEKQIIGQKVTWNFNPSIVLGKVDAVHRNGDTIIATMSLNSIPLHDKALFAVLGGIVNESEDIAETGGKKITRFTVCEISLTENPADQSLPPIEEI